MVDIYTSVSSTNKEELEQIRETLQKAGLSSLRIFSNSEEFIENFKNDPFVKIVVFDFFANTIDASVILKVALELKRSCKMVLIASNEFENSFKELKTIVQLYDKGIFRYITKRDSDWLEQVKTGCLQALEEVRSEERLLRRLTEIHQA